MKSARFMLLATAFAVLGSTAATAASGVWVADGSFQVSNFNRCFRTYTCQPASSQMYSADQRLVTTPPQTVYGTCSAAGGSIEECNACLTSEPALPCEWHLEPR